MGQRNQEIYFKQLVQMLVEKQTEEYKVVVQATRKRSNNVVTGGHGVTITAAFLNIFLTVDHACFST